MDRVKEGRKVAAWTGRFSVRRRGDEIGFGIARGPVRVTAWLTLDRAGELGCWLIDQEARDDAH